MLSNTSFNALTLKMLHAGSFSYLCDENVFNALTFFRHFSSSQVLNANDVKLVYLYIHIEYKVFWYIAVECRVIAYYIQFPCTV